MSTAESTGSSEKHLKPLGKNERRVLGVLVEKAKTTPDNYPMSVAAIVAGANQKSNRSPLMQLDEDDVQLALDELKAVGAAREVQGSGRVNKFRHVAYEWLGVDAAGVAVMTELLLRGPQTAGELRARASRMHEFADLESVVSCLDALTSAGLVKALTPPGRGQTFAHTLYPPDEMRYLSLKVTQQDEDLEGVSSSAPAVAQSDAYEARLAMIDARIEELNSRIAELENRLQ